MISSSSLKGARGELSQKKVPLVLFSSVTNYLLASSIATATATVIPTIGLLPAPISPIISTH